MEGPFSVYVLSEGNDGSSADFKSLGSRPHMQIGKFLMKFSGRKDGQFRSGGLLVGDRPFSLVDLGRWYLDYTLQRLSRPVLWANGTRITEDFFRKNVTAGDLEFGPWRFGNGPTMGLERLALPVPLAAGSLHRSVVCHSCNHLWAHGLLTSQKVWGRAHGRRHGVGGTDYGLHWSRSCTGMDSVDVYFRHSQLHQCSGHCAGDSSKKHVPQ
jgi:hypothetical protein